MAAVEGGRFCGDGDAVAFGQRGWIELFLLMFVRLRTSYVAGNDLLRWGWMTGN